MIETKSHLNIKYFSFEQPTNPPEVFDPNKVLTEEDWQDIRNYMYRDDEHLKQQFRTFSKILYCVYLINPDQKNKISKRGIILDSILRDTHRWDHNTIQNDWWTRLLARQHLTQTELNKDKRTEYKHIAISRLNTIDYSTRDSRNIDFLANCISLFPELRNSIPLPSKQRVFELMSDQFENPNLEETNSLITMSKTSIVYSAKILYPSEPLFNRYNKEKITLINDALKLLRSGHIHTSLVSLSQLPAFDAERIEVTPDRIKFIPPTPDLRATLKIPERRAF